MARLVEAREQVEVITTRMARLAEAREQVEVHVKRAIGELQTGKLRERKALPSLHVRVYVYSMAAQSLGTGIPVN